MRLRERSGQLRLWSWFLLCSSCMLLTVWAHGGQHGEPAASNQVPPPITRLDRNMVQDKEWVVFNYFKTCAQSKSVSFCSCDTYVDNVRWFSFDSFLKCTLCQMTSAPEQPDLISVCLPANNMSGKQRSYLIHPQKIKNTAKTVILWNIIAISSNCFLFFKCIFPGIYSCDAKLNFQHHYSSLQCHMILQKSF